MPAFTATAPGKVILFGEHAVVYGRPAVAAPVNQVRARAVVSANPRGVAGEVRFQAPDINLEARLDELDTYHPMSSAVLGVLAELGVDRSPACTVRITSTIPVAAGLGSGAAVTIALIRAFSAFLGRPLPDERVSSLAYEVEKIHHGTPSGIDNTVITYALPVYFVRGELIEILHLPVPFTILIADTGIASSTAAVVGDVRRAWLDDPARYEAYFDLIGRLSQAARRSIESGQTSSLGSVMNDNHALLREMGVSSPELDRLVHIACSAGASGAKLSGGGRGGNVIALVTKETVPIVAQALQAAGAARTISTTIQEPSNLHVK